MFDNVYHKRFMVDLTIDNKPLGKPASLEDIADAISDAVFGVYPNHVLRGIQDMNTDSIKERLHFHLEYDFESVDMWIDQVWDFDLNAFCEERVDDGYPKSDILYGAGVIGFSVDLELVPIEVDEESKQLLVQLAEGDLDIDGLFKLADHENIDSVEELENFVQNFREQVALEKEDKLD